MANNITDVIDEQGWHLGWNGDVIVSLAIQMWSDNDPDGLEDEFGDLIKNADAFGC